MKNNFDEEIDSWKYVSENKKERIKEIINSYHQSLIQEAESKSYDSGFEDGLIVSEKKIQELVEKVEELQNEQDGDTSYSAGQIWAYDQVINLLKTLSKK